MKLLVDNREPKGLKELLGVRLKNIEICNLDIGDYIIKNDNDETVMIFERKSLADLIASIKDGRYAEQSFRLSQLPISNHNIYYVIEGDTTAFILKNTEQVRKMLFSSMLSLSYTKGFSLLRTNGWLETAEFLIRFLEKWGTPPHPQPYYIDNIASIPTESIGTLPNYTNAIKASKKSNITKDNIGEIMLAQIPGLSMNVAQSLMEKYKTIKNLIKELEKDENCLDDFKVECKNGMRKLSKPVIQKLMDYL
jgi:ERCC4-type nuclease